MVLMASGELHFAMAPHTHVVLRRRIQTLATERAIQIHDTVINEGHNRAPHQIHYRIHAGFPIVSELSSFACGHKSVTPWDAESGEEYRHFNLCTGPTLGGQSRDFFLEAVPFTDGRSGAAVLASDLGQGMALAVRFDHETLPMLRLTKTFQQGGYHIAFGPTNSFGVGLDRQQAFGFQRYLEPGERIEHFVEIRVLEGPNELRKFERECHLATPESVVMATELT
jgi:hypothetical protein